MKSGVYKILNLVNGDYYIGSSKNVEKRIICHFSKLRKNKHHSKKLQNSFNKYGHVNFSHQIIELCEAEILQQREQHYLDALFNEKCLNILKDAYSTRGENHPMFGRRHSEESRAKIKLARSKQTISHSQETRLKIGASNKGRPFNIDHINKMIQARSKTPWNKGISCPSKFKTVLSPEVLEQVNISYKITKSINKTAKQFNLDWEVTKRHLKL